MQENRQLGKPRGLSSKYRLFLMALPFIILVFVFAYFPLHGWLYAFYNYRPGISLKVTEFVGFKWFKSIIANEIQRGEVLRVMKNTMAMSSLNILAGTLPVFFAIFLSEIKSVRYKKMVQTLTTLPNFISWVLVYSFAFFLFNTNTGFINKVLIQIGLLDRGVNFLASTDYIWLKMTFWGIWKGLGWGAIIYLAAIAGIDQELYEAGRIDGAGRFQLIRHITIPGILGTYFVLLLLSIANFINNGMEQYFVFQNAMNKETIEVLDLYVYNIGLGGGSFSFATAVSMLKSVISVFLLFFANSLSKLVRGETII